MAADFKPITDAVAAETSVDQSAITLLGNLSAMLTAAKNDPAAIQAIADQITANQTALAAAVVANTPVTPAQAKAKK